MGKFGLIFDCDGTLVDSLGAALESFNHSLNAVGQEPRTIEEIKVHFGTGADRIFVKMLGDEKLGLAAFEAYVEHQARLALQMNLHNGIRELLETASAAQVPMGVVTGRHARDLDVVLRPHKLADYFQVLIADSHVAKSKPAPEGILMALQRLGLEPGHVCYVGDSLSDMQAAHAAGCVAVAALWDELADQDKLAAGQPDFYAQSPAQVWDYFCNWSGR